MIASDEAAKQVVALLLDASGAIDQSVAEVKQRGTEEELAAYSVRDRDSQSLRVPLCLRQFVAPKI